MACLDMFNNEQHQGLYAPMSPRISFSNDFVDTQRIIKQHNENRSPSSSSASAAAAAASSDFEFSVSNYSMMAADELFSKGRLLPYKDNNPNSTSTNKLFQKMTLRDELLNNTDHHHQTSSATAPRPPKAGGSIRWKELLGLKRSRNTVSKKSTTTTANKNDGTSSSIGSSKLGQESSQEVETEGGGSSTSCRDEDENGNI